MAFYHLKATIAIVVPQKTAYLEGKNFKGILAIGRIDNTIKPTKIIINNKTINQNLIHGSTVELNFPVEKIGKNELKGQFIFMENGYPVTVPIESSYFVLSNSK